MTTYIDWDYDTLTAIRYKRIGECNNCGDCCKRLIKMKLVEGDSQTHGGITTNGECRWSEIENGDKREFVKFSDHEDPDHKPCVMLVDNMCSINGEKPWCCTVWPTSPSDIKSFKNCSYGFEVIKEWEFEAEEYNE